MEFRLKLHSKRTDKMKITKPNALRDALNQQLNPKQNDPETRIEKGRTAMYGN